MVSLITIIIIISAKKKFINKKQGRPHKKENHRNLHGIVSKENKERYYPILLNWLQKNRKDSQTEDELPKRFSNTRLLSSFHIA